MPRLKFVSKVEGADTIELQEPIITIGRGTNNVICIEDANISKHHVLLILEDSVYRIFDLHSINGTTVNGKKIGTATLQNGDAVRIGYLDLIYETATPSIATPAVPELPTAPTPPPTPAESVAPAPAAPAVPPTPPEPVVTIAAAPAKRPFLGFGKRVPAPTPAPEPAAPAAVAPVVATPPPPAPVTPEPPAAPTPDTPSAPAPSQKKFGAPPGGQNLKFRLKRE